MSDLDKLIEAVEGGELDARKCGAYGSVVATYCNGGSLTFLTPLWAYEGSLDAAKALHDALLPECLWSMTPLGKAGILDKSFNVIAESPYSACEARAWLLAILKAYRAQVPQ